MNKYEMPNPKKEDNQMSTRKSGNAIDALAKHKTKTLKSFLNKDTNAETEKFYAKEELKNTLTWVERDGKMVQIDVKDLKKKK